MQLSHTPRVYTNGCGFCKRLKFGYTTNSFMHKPESVQENEKRKIPRDFENKPISPSLADDQT